MPLPPVPEEPGHWLLGSAREIARAPHRFMLETAARHGGIAQFRLLRRPVVVISDPELAQQVLVTRWEHYERGAQNRNLGILGGDGLLSTEGPVWLKRRRQIQPAFRRERFEQLVPVVSDCVRRMLDDWERQRAAGRPVALGAEMLRLAMSAMGRMLLSIEIPRETGDRIGVILRDGLLLLRRRNTSPWPPPLWLPTPSNRRLLQYRQELASFVEEHLRARELSPAPANPDLLNALLDVRDPETGKRLSHEEVADETKTLFLAGFETTATALTWALYLLARHPAEAALLHREVDTVLTGRAPTWNDLPKLPYTAQVLHEAMRLYPPVYAVARRCMADDELGGYRIPQATPVLISIYGVHRAPVWGDDAENFRPARFAPGVEWPKRAYIPFAAGRHLCIGNDFAAVEMTVALAAIAQRYRFTVTETVGESARITLVPDREIDLRLEPR